MDNINYELQQIQANRYGVDIRVPIHDALRKLSETSYSLLTENTDGAPINYPRGSKNLMIDIVDELNIIKTAYPGKEVKKAIHDALEKLSRMTTVDMVVTGLTGFNAAFPSRPDAHDPNYISGLTSGNTDFSNLATFMKASGAFSDVTVVNEDTPTYEKTGINVYDNGDLFATLSCTMSKEYGYTGDPVYTLTVYHSDGENDYTFPSNDDDRHLNRCLIPKAAYRTEYGVLISCEDNAILFSKNSSNGVSVSFGDGLIEQIQDENILESIYFTPNVTITSSNFNQSTVFDYKRYFTQSKTAKVSDILQVRDDSAQLIGEIRCTYGSNIGTAPICFGYSITGGPDKIYRATDVANGVLNISNDTFYICIIKYSTIDLTLDWTVPITNPKRRIRTLTNEYTINSYSGISHSDVDSVPSTTMGLTPLISELDGETSYRGYAITAGRMGDTNHDDGIIGFGAKNLYIANNMLALELHPYYYYTDMVGCIYVGTDGKVYAGMA